MDISGEFPHHYVVLLLRRALRQEQAVQQAHRAVEVERERSGHRSGFLPPRPAELEDCFADQLYFFVLTVSQAVKARKLLTEQGNDMPLIHSGPALAALRDVLEHWDEPVRGNALRALPKWERLKGTDPDYSFTTSSGAGNESILTDIEGLSLTGLRADLRAVLDVAELLRREWFDSAWLTAHAASEYLGIDEVPAVSPCAGLGTMTWPDLGRRYYRPHLDAWRECMERLGKLSPRG